MKEKFFIYLNELKISCYLSRFDVVRPFYLRIQYGIKTVEVFENIYSEILHHYHLPNPDRGHETVIMMVDQEVRDYSTETYAFSKKQSNVVSSDLLVVQYILVEQVVQAKSEYLSTNDVQVLTWLLLKSAVEEQYQ